MGINLQTKKIKIKSIFKASDSIGKISGLVILWKK